jgi:DDE superfamily endonuclease/Winged helix-turn helix
LQHTVARDPRLVRACPEPAHQIPTCPWPRPAPEPPGSRWTLAAIRQVCVWLRDYSRSGVWRVLRSLDIHWKRGRQHVHSPDPDYDAKLARVAALRDLVAGDPDRQLLLFQDELTYYRQPTVGSSYGPAGHPQPLAELSYARNTATRVVATLNGRTGQVAYLQAGHIGVRELVRCYAALCAQHPTAQRIYLVQDNWPVHFHPDVLAALEPQDNPFPWVYPRHWPTAPSPQARRLDLPIQLVTLPTYASWTNPIEKLWRWLKHDVLHLHPWADDLAELRRQVLAFLDRFADGSAALLRYVGLEPAASGLPP